MDNKLNCVLLIDDSPADNFLHKIVVNDCDVTDNVRTAEDGIDGLDYLLNNGKYSGSTDNPKPNLILLDINMPKMNGFEFVEEFEKLDSSIKENTIIMMLSTSLEQSDKTKAISYKAVKEYLQKPLDEQTFKFVVNKYFNH